VVEPDDAAFALLIKLREVRVVLDYVFLEPIVSADTETLHRAAFIVGLEEVSRWRAVEPPEPDEVFEGRALDADEFFGHGFDRASGRLLMTPSFGVLREVGRRNLQAQRPPDSYGPYTLSDADDVDHLIWWPKAAERRGGYAHAFAHRPGGLRMSHRGVQKLFATVNDVVLGSPSSRTTMFLWHPPLSAFFKSDYFQVGYDLYGSAVWTVARPDGRIVFIGYSADECEPYDD
jgi:hypothetical protein